MKAFAIEAIKLLPDYFYEIPASSTGKYHSKTCLGRSGLVRHTKAAVMIAKSLFDIKYYDEKFSQREKDMILIALMLHDGMKSGATYSKYTAFDHPLIIADAIENDDELKEMISSEDLHQICNAIRSHMGFWNTANYSAVVLPVPQTEMELFVHLADYMASRSYLTYEFGDDYFVLDEQDDELNAHIHSIIARCKSLIDEGRDRNELFDVIMLHNNGKRNPNTITDIEIAKKILEQLG